MATQELSPWGRPCCLKTLLNLLPMDSSDATHTRCSKDWKGFGVICPNSWEMGELSSTRTRPRSLELVTQVKAPKSLVSPCSKADCWDQLWSLWEMPGEILHSPNFTKTLNQSHMLKTFPSKKTPNKPCFDPEASSLKEVSAPHGRY